MVESSAVSRLRIAPLAVEEASAFAHFVAVERSRTYAAIVTDGFLDRRLAEVDDEAADIVARLRSDTDVRYAVAWDGETIAGVAATLPSPMPWELELGIGGSPASRALDVLYVAPAWHGSGLADRLLEQVLDERPTMLWLIHGNERARRFYERRGWALWGEEVSTGPEWDEMPMRRMLLGVAEGPRG